MICQVGAGVSELVVLTLGSMMPGVCTSTTCCTNLTQQMRTPDGAESIWRSILDLIASMSCQWWLSLRSETLKVHSYMRNGSVEEATEGMLGPRSVPACSSCRLARVLHAPGVTYMCL